MKKFLYFAYGSNLNVGQMKQRCPDSAGVSTAVLNGWKLTEISGIELCLQVVLKAKEIYNGME